MTALCVMNSKKYRLNSNLFFGMLIAEKDEIGISCDVSLERRYAMLDSLTG